MGTLNPSANQPMASESRSGFRRWRVPMGLLGLMLVALLFPTLWSLAWVAADADTVPGAMQVGPLAFLVALIALLLLAGWWLFVSGVPYTIRFAVPLVLLFGLAGFVLSIRKVELTLAGNGLRPRFWFAWDKTPEDHFHEFVTTQQPANDLPPIDLTVTEGDSPRYRGVRCDGVSSGPELATDWTTQPPKVVWRQRCGDGYSGLSVVGNVVVTQEQRPEGEAVVCYDRASGRLRWVRSFPGIHYQDLSKMGDGPRATPTIDGDAIFTLGATGELARLDARTGEVRWQINILADCLASNVSWGMTGSPLVVDGKVIVNAGIDAKHMANRCLAAYDRETGHRIWATGNRPAGYSSPQCATLGGVEQILIFDGGGLNGVEPASGRTLWSFAWKTYQDMNIIQPLVFPGDRVFLSSEMDNGCAMLQVKKTGDDWTVEPIWQNRYLSSKFSNPVTDGSAIYGLSTGNGFLTCLDVATGQKRWKGNRYGPGQIIRRGQQLVIVGDAGFVALVAADPTAYREWGRFSVFSGKTWNTHALVGRHLFLRNQEEIACLELP